MDLFSLKGEIAFVTGAASGIGQRIAVGLAEAGADVACFDLPMSAAGLGDTVARIHALGRRALALEGDVTSPDSLAAGVEAAERDLGPLGVAVNAAGIINAGAAEDMPVEQWERMMKVNVEGVFLSCQAQARVMLPRKRGSIVNIGSMSGTIANRGLLMSHYNCSKAAVVHLSKSLAIEWADRGVRVNSISPGYVLTAMTERPEAAAKRSDFEHETPLGRLATVDEMVGPAVFLSSRAASYCTGSNLIVDGGYVSW